MKHSIRKQLALIFIGLMAGVVLLCWCINTLFLEEYYISSKTKVLYDAYGSIWRAAGSDTYGTEEFKKRLDDVCSMYNITIYVMDAGSQVKYASINGGLELEIQLFGYILGVFPHSVKVVDQGEDYVVQRIRQEGAEYLEMYGRLTSGISFIMRTPVESIRESANVANRFFAYVGAAGTVAGGIIIWCVSKKITDPIRKLNEISEQMVHLNFEAKYVGRGKSGSKLANFELMPAKADAGYRNEIDLLGANINKLSASLEKSISELKTANNELQKDIEKREQIDEMRKEFLANVSHELKTPIALIQGYAEGLTESVNDDPEGRAFYCEVIVDEASKMNTMVQKLLTLNQLEFGNDVVSMERFDITQMIQNFVQSAAILTRSNDIEVLLKASEPVYVWADEYKTEEVFRNYFSNAVNHCGGEKKIVVSVEKREEGLVRVSVFNTGEKIPEESLSHLWEKFYKVDKARTREYGGSGVGLSIVKAIQESMNRLYGVENYSNGVLFWFELESARQEAG